MVTSRILGMLQKQGPVTVALRRLTVKESVALLRRNTLYKTLLRLKGLELGAPIISCGEGHRFMVAQQIGEISEEKPTILLEPMAKNTAPAIAAIIPPTRIFFPGAVNTLLLFFPVS